MKKISIRALRFYRANRKIHDNLDKARRAWMSRSLREVQGKKDYRFKLKFKAVKFLMSFG